MSSQHSTVRDNGTLYSLPVESFEPTQWDSTKLRRLTASHLYAQYIHTYPFSGLLQTPKVDPALPMLFDP